MSVTQFNRFEVTLCNSIFQSSLFLLGKQYFMQLSVFLLEIWLKIGFSDFLKLCWKAINLRWFLENSILRKKCPYSELFWPVFSRIWTEYHIQSECGKIRTRITPNTDTFHTVANAESSSLHIQNRYKNSCCETSDLILFDRHRRGLLKYVNVKKLRKSI